MKPFTLILFSLVFFLAGCSKKQNEEDRITDSGLFQLTVQLDWRPEPEHGGLFYALVNGYFEAAGLEVDLVPGGPNALVTQRVATGKADIGQSASTQVMFARSNGFPLVSIASVFHYLPTGLMMHESNPITKFEELDGKTIMARPEAVYIPYLKNKYKIDFEVIPQNFGLASFLADKDFIQEGFYIAEPYFLRREGAQVKWLPLSDAGYLAYAVLFSNEDFLGTYPEQTRAFIDAYIRGWEGYLRETGYESTHAYLKTINDGLTDGFLEFSRNQILQDRLVEGDPAKGEAIGRIQVSRIEAEVKMLEELDLLEPGQLRAKDVATETFLPSP